MEHVGGIGSGVYHQFTGGDSRGAALGPEFIEARGTGADTAVGSDVGAAHGSSEHPVAESDIPQSDGGREMRIMGHGFLLWKVPLSGGSAGTAGR